MFLASFTVPGLPESQIPFLNSPISCSCSLIYTPESSLGELNVEGKINQSNLERRLNSTAVSK